MIRKAIMPVAGFGTRFLPATKVIPKEMMPLVSKPVVQYVVEEAAEAGIEQICLVTSRGKSAIEDHFDRAPELEAELHRAGKETRLRQVQEVSDLTDIYSVRQKQPLGLGHAVLAAKSFAEGEAVAVLLGDDVVDAETPCIKQLIEVFEQYEAPVVGVEKVSREAVSSYGVIDAEPLDDGVHEVHNLVEKPAPEDAPSNLAVIGRYILTPAIFSVLEGTSPDDGGEIQLTDALAAKAQEHPIYACEFSGNRHDAGTHLGFAKATVELARKHPVIGEKFRSYLEEVGRE